MLGFPLAVLFFMLLQLFHYSGNDWYSMEICVMFSGQMLFHFSDWEDGSEGYQQLT